MKNTIENLFKAFATVDIATVLDGLDDSNI